MAPSDILSVTALRADTTAAPSVNHGAPWAADAPPIAELGTNGIGLQLRPVGRIRRSVVEPIWAITEGSLIVAAGLSTAILYQLCGLKIAGVLSDYVAAALITALLYVLSAHRYQLYSIQNLLRGRDDHQRVLGSWCFAIIVLTITLAISKSGDVVSGGPILGFSLFGGIAVAAGHKLIKSQLRRAVEASVICGRRAIVLGDAKELASLSRQVLLTRFGIEEVARVSFRQDGASNRTLTKHAVDEAVRRASEANAEEILVVVPWANPSQLMLIRNQLSILPLPVRLLPDRRLSTILADAQTGDAQSLLVDVRRAPLSTTEQTLKRTLDIVGAVALLLALSPLMAITALAIKYNSPGPVIFRQRRNGFSGRQFTIYKFRTMTVLEDGPTIVQARPSDRRVTRVGRVLRKLSIDELPQLFNVLKGDMSLVGPRPHALAHDDMYSKLIANYAFRQHVKPGISGWAQVNGLRGETPDVNSMAARVDYDLWYIKNWSLLLDIQILLRTCREVACPRNAY